MNRNNVKIVILSFVVLAAVTWMGGYIIFGRQGTEELYCLEQYDNLIKRYAFTDDVRDHTVALYKSTRDNNSEDLMLRQQAARKINIALKEQKQELLEEASWIDKMLEHKSRRLSERAKFNYSSSALLCFALMFGIILFITTPKPETPSPQAP